MRLHELKEGKIYIGEDWLEYKILDNSLCQVGGHGYVVTSLSALTQNFTPKKVKQIIEERCWINKYPKNTREHFWTKEGAESYARHDRIACIEMVGTYEIEVEE